jgi:hypothetical protein
MRTACGHCSRRNGSGTSHRAPVALPCGLGRRAKRPSLKRCGPGGTTCARRAGHGVVQRWSVAAPSDYAGLIVEYPRPGCARRNEATHGGQVVLSAALYTANSKHARMSVSPIGGLACQHRVATGGAPVHTSGGSGTAPRWVRLVRSGNTFTAFTSTKGTSRALVERDTNGDGRDDLRRAADHEPQERHAGGDDDREREHHAAMNGA